jgi:hypothetical protein
MSTATRQVSQTLAQDEQRRRANAVRDGIASARIEGGDVGAEAHAIMNEWAQGLIDHQGEGRQDRPLQGVAHAQKGRLIRPITCVAASCLPDANFLVLPAR